MGYGSRLIQEGLDDARAQRMKGVAMLTSDRTWLAGKDIFERNGFKEVDSAPPSFRLMAARFGSDPSTATSTSSARRLRTKPEADLPKNWDERARAFGPGLTVIRTAQCPNIDYISGYQFKGGASYRATDEWDIFANAGYVSKVPIFDQVINDVNGTKVEDPKNEKFISFEAGVNSRLLQNQLTLKLNGYYTLWSDRAQSANVINADGTDGLVRLDGINSTFAGIELEAAYQPIQYIRLDGAFSQGFWTYTDDVSGSHTGLF